MHASSEASVELLCQSLCNEPRTLACALSRADLSNSEPIRELLRIEAEKVAPLGFNLIGTNTIDAWTHFALHVRSTGKGCATFEFLPETGEFRRVGKCGQTE